jgi:zeaxanthin epoxidase
MTLQPVLQYVIFPLQFAYLYSYHPSGSMKQLPAELEKKWKVQHFNDAEAAFKRVAAEGQVSAGPSFFQKAKDTPLTVMQAKKNDD